MNNYVKWVALISVVLVFPATFWGSFVVTGQSSVSVDKIMANLSLKELIGQLFWVAFRKSKSNGIDVGEEQINITSINKSIQRFIEQYRPGGMILFAENIKDPEQTKNFIMQLQEVIGAIPGFMGVDLEGGSVNSLPYGPLWPGNMAIGALPVKQGEEIAFNVGSMIGKELKVLGFNVDFAPVLDVNSNPNNPVINVRSFGSDPQRVAQLGESMMLGLQESIIAVSKHFPGHGDTEVDSHIGMPVINKTIEQLKQVELIPFIEAIAKGVEMLMMAHLLVSSIDKNYPTSLSREIITKILKQQLNFKGLIITDALDMGAIVQMIPDEDVGIVAINAGVDMILMPNDFEKAYKKFYQAVQLDKRLLARVQESVLKILTLKMKRKILDIAPLVALTTWLFDFKAMIEKHEKLEQEIMQKAVTLIENKKVLPVGLKFGERVVFCVENSGLQNIITSYMKTFFPEIMSDFLVYDGLKEFDQLMLNKLKNIACCITVVNNKVQQNQEILKELHDILSEQQVKNIVLLARYPGQLGGMLGSDGAVAVYGFKKLNIDAGLDAIFGKTKPQGILPVDIIDNHRIDNKKILYKCGHGLVY
jgi:beta-N-acetylhexosaminidase